MLNTRTLRRLWALLLALWLGAPTARADENDAATPAQPVVAAGTDVVFLLDVSGSMRKRQGLKRARALLIDSLDKVVHPGTQVALIPFGTGVHKPQRFAIPRDPEGAAQARREIRAAIGKVRANDSYTYLFQGIEKGLETLMEFKRKNPGHGRYVILVSDGKQLVRRGEKWLTLKEVLDRFGEMGFKRGSDWFIWYGHFGEPDDSLRRALEESGAGKTISLDEIPTMRWAYTRLAPAVIDLGRRVPGAWTQMVKLVAETDALGVGKKLRLDVDRGSLPDWVTLAVEPREVELTGQTTEIALEVRCVGAGAGVYDDVGLRVSSEEGTLHWVETKRIGLEWKVSRPRIDLGATELQLGRVPPGMEAAQRVALIPNPDAAEAAPEVRVTVLGVPEGLRIAVDRPVVRADGRQEVEVSVRVPPGATPGAYESRVRFESLDHVAVIPPELKVHYRVGFGRVTVGQDRVVVSPILQGREAAATVTLTPDADTGALAPEIGVKLSGVPDGVVAELPARIKVSGRVHVPLKVRVPYGALTGRHEATLRFTAPRGVKVEPAEVPVVLDVVRPSKLMLPSLVDLGDVPASKARSIDGRLKLAVGEHLAGSQLELVAGEGGAAIEPRVLTLQQGTTDVAVQLKSVATDLGPHEARFQAFFTRDGTRRSAGTITFRWRVTETFVRVRNWAVPPAMATGNSEATGTLVVEASSDLIGRRLRLATLFKGLAKGMSLELGREEVVLEGGLQSVPVRFLARGARTGRYRGSLRVGFGEQFEGVQEPKPLDVTIQITGASVFVALQGSLDGLHPGAERTLFLVLTAQAVPVPTTLTVALDREGLPQAISAEVPEVVNVDRADGTTRVPLRFVVGSDVTEGRWQPRLTVKARTPGVAVAPESVAVSAGVPNVVTVYRDRESKAALWIGLTALFLVLALAAYLFLRPKPKKVMRVDVPTEKEQALSLNELNLAEEDDMVVIEGLGLGDE